MNARSHNCGTLAESVHASTATPPCCIHVGPLSVADASAQPSPVSSRRRLLMNALVSVASVATATAIPSSFVAGNAIDPIHNAIAAHRTACSEWWTAMLASGDLEEIIPPERRKAYHDEHRRTHIGKDDDPRWTAAQNTY